jgi:hypothetical protein
VCQLFKQRCSYWLLSQSLVRQQAPRTCDLYALDIPVSAVRAKVKENFRKNANVSEIFIFSPYYCYVEFSCSVSSRVKSASHVFCEMQVTDTRVIDMLLVKGQMELDEVHNFWKQKTHVV